MWVLKLHQRDFRLRPRRKWDLPSSGILRSTLRCVISQKSPYLRLYTFTFMLHPFPFWQDKVRIQLHLVIHSSPVFLKLGSAKGCRGFRQTKMRSGRRVVLEFLNLYLQIKICVATFDINHSATDSTQTVNRCFNPEASLFCSQVSQHTSPLTESMCQAIWSRYRPVWG